MGSPYDQRPCVEESNEKDVNYSETDPFFSSKLSVCGALKHFGALLFDFGTNTTWGENKSQQEAANNEIKKTIKARFERI